MKKNLTLITIFSAIVLLVLAALIKKTTAVDKNELIIFHAGSLAVPFKQICEEFSRTDPSVNISCEAAGSRICARKITDLNRPCDIMASADYTVIDTLLIPKHADFNIKFASNQMVIAFHENSAIARQINKNNWFEILLKKNVAFGRSDPNSDPCGYRSVFVMKLAEKYYNRPGLAVEMAGKDQKYIRPKEVDLLALLEAGELDYIFIYRSVAKQHGLKILTLPDQINLSNAEFADFYKTASIRLTGKRPGEFITKKAQPILYGVTIPKNASNRELAERFLKFLLDPGKGGVILEKNGQNFIASSFMNK
ncbi:tungstate ABC transporter substrate-binding protein WtpA [Planctomycetota bacterium]